MWLEQTYPSARGPLIGPQNGKSIRRQRIFISFLPIQEHGIAFGEMWANSFPSMEDVLSSIESHHTGKEGMVVETDFHYNHYYGWRQGSKEWFNFPNIHQSVYILKPTRPTLRVKRRWFIYKCECSVLQERMNYMVIASPRGIHLIPEYRINLIDRFWCEDKDDKA